jgi:hypothetical protein
MSDIEAIAKKYFDKSLTDRERAIFEGAITLGATYHQFVGTPISSDEKVVKSLEDAIANAMALQPHKKSIRLKIDRSALKGEKAHPYDYETLKGRHMDLRVVSEYGDSRATLRMRYISDVDFTLMYVEKIEKI